jgi:chemotaxis protein MotB
MTIPRDANGGPKEALGIGKDKAKFEAIKRSLLTKLSSSKDLRRYARHLRFTLTDQGLRIDMVDEADFSMFLSGTSILTPDAANLLGQVGTAIKELPNGIIIRGHTDAATFANTPGANNWQLSADRAEMTRVLLTRQGVAASRILRIEGVADREPYVAQDKFDPRNRRMSIILGWDTAG